MVKPFQLLDKPTGNPFDFDHREDNRDNLRDTDETDQTHKNHFHFIHLT